MNAIAQVPGICAWCQRPWLSACGRARHLVVQNDLLDGVSIFSPLIMSTLDVVSPTVINLSAWLALKSVTMFLSAGAHQG